MKTYKTESGAKEALKKQEKKDPNGMYTIKKTKEGWIVVFLGGLFTLLLFIYLNF